MHRSLRRLFSFSFAARCREMSDNGGKGVLETAGITSDPKAVPASDWKKLLPADVYEITREAATEPAGSGKYNAHKAAGEYNCVCCGEKLFESEAKFDSGCGWPAFFAAEGDEQTKKNGTKEAESADSKVTRIADDSYGYQRVEVRCKKCDAHLGHVFNDAPQWTPTGERYCINSACLTFKPSDQCK